MEFSEILKKAWSYPNYKKEFLKNPQSILSKEGIQIPENVKIFVHENSNNEIHIVLPKKPESELSDEELQNIAGGFWWTGPLAGVLWDQFLNKAPVHKGRLDPGPQK